MTIRQIYYSLAPLGLKDTEVARACKRGREEGLISLDLIVDRSRPSYGLDVWEDKNEVLEWLSKHFKLDYWRDSEFRVEIWTEKDALSQILFEVSDKHRVPVRATRGFLSISNRWRWGNEKLKILYFGDHDPSGLCMDKDLKTDQFLKSESFKRIALTSTQIEEFNLADYVIPVNKKDPRAKEYIAQYGEFGWELDALPPDELRRFVVESIEKHVDFDLEEKRAEERAIREEFKRMIE